MKSLWNRSLRVALTLFVLVALLPLNMAQAGSLTSEPPNNAPVAVDDGGVGFATDADTPFTTASVLANDSDANGDPLQVAGLDDSATLGLVESVQNIAGGLDNEFGENGKVTTYLDNDYAEIYGMALQPDGKIVAVGYASDGAALARYNADGSLDSDFGDEGTVILYPENDHWYFNAVALQGDGRIVAAGQYDGDIFVARFTATGTLDTGFDTDGWTTVAFEDSANGTGLAIQPDGKIVVAGYFYSSTHDNNDFTVLRFLADGTLDTGFDGDGIQTTDLGGSDIFTGLALQGDGGIVAVGYTNGINDNDFAVARYTATGTLDTTFSSDGLVTTDFGDNDYGYCMTIQPDGKILAGGTAYNGSDEDFALARYTATGTLDTTFNSDGTQVADLSDSDDYLYALKLQADGKIVAAGYSDDGNYVDFALARFSPNGALDSDFGSDGWATARFYDYAYAYAMAIQADGKIVAGGGAYDENGDYEFFALARFNVNTLTFPTFNYDPNGMFTALDVGEVATDTFVYTVSDGDLSATATVSITINGVNDTPTANDQSLSMVEETPVDFTLSGSDPENNPLSGWTITYSPQHGSLSGTAPNLTYTPELNFFGADRFYFTVSDGSLTSQEGQVTITVTNVNDAPLPGDDGGSGFSTDEQTAFQSFSVLSNDSDPDGDAVQISAWNTSGTLGLATITSSIGGALDSSFDGDGLVMTSYDTGNWEWSEGRAIAVQPDGKIVVGGTTANKFTVARYNVDGSLDSSFGSGGKVITSTGGYATGRALLLQPDGKIVLAGDSSDKFALARYTASGTLDSSFDGDGLLVTTFSDSCYIYGLALQEDGKIVAVGHIWMSNSNDDFALARYNPDGSLDATFSDDGKLTTDFSASFDHARDALIQPDGKIVVSGEAGHKFGLARYNPDGTLDTTFSGDGKLTTVIGSGSGSANATSVAIQPDGKIVAGGFADSPVTWHYNFAVARYHPNGTLDSSFGSGGQQLTEFGSSAISYGMALQDDGAIVLAGYTSNPNDFALARYNASGAPDAGFDGDGKLTTNFPLYESLFAVALQADGKIVVTGTAYAGMQFNMALARYIPGGEKINYDPNGQFEHLGVGETAIDSLLYTLTDGVVSASATVSITIHGVNDGPTAASQTLSVYFDLPTSIALNASDIDSDVVTNTIVTAPLHGTLNGTGLNVFYTPQPGYHGADSFTYYVSDGFLTSATVTVTLDVALEPLKIFLPLIGR